jgi:hypothetical protein
MTTEQKIKELEKELKEIKESNRSMWDSYGSELCAGAMINEEEKLEKEIERLKAKQNE